MIYITDQPHLSGPNKEVKTWHMFCYPRAVELMHNLAREACVARVQYVEGADGKMPSYHVDEQQRLLLLSLGIAEVGYDQAFKCGQSWSLSPAPKPSISTEGGDWQPGDLDDESPMPFGKHKNNPMSAVPASYLLWFMEQDWAAEKYPGVYRYATKNRKRLIDEDPDHVDNSDY